MKATISTIFIVTEVKRGGYLGESYKVEVSDTGQPAAMLTRNTYPRHQIILHGFNIDNRFVPFLNR